MFEMQDYNLEAAELEAAGFTEARKGYYFLIDGKLYAFDRCEGFPPTKYHSGSHYIVLEGSVKRFNWQELKSKNVMWLEKRHPSYRRVAG